MFYDADGSVQYFCLNSTLAYGVDFTLHGWCFGVCMDYLAGAYYLQVYARAVASLSECHSVYGSSCVMLEGFLPLGLSLGDRFRHPDLHCMNFWSLDWEEKCRLCCQTEL